MVDVSGSKWQCKSHYDDYGSKTLNVFKLLDTYPLERINIQDAAVTTDGRRIIAVGDLTESPNGLKPKKGQTEKQIIGAFS